MISCFGVGVVVDISWYDMDVVGFKYFFLCSPLFGGRFIFILWNDQKKGLVMYLLKKVTVSLNTAHEKPSNEKKPWLFRLYRGWNTTQLYGGIIINRYKDPYIPTSLMETTWEISKQRKRCWHFQALVSTTPPGIRSFSVGDWGWWFFPKFTVKGYG